MCDLAERLGDLVELFGQFAAALALLARLEVGRKRPAAFFDHARKVARKRFDIDGTDPDRLLRRSTHQRFLEFPMGSKPLVQTSPLRTNGPLKSAAQGDFSGVRQKKCRKTRQFAADP